MGNCLRLENKQKQKINKYEIDNEYIGSDYKKENKSNSIEYLQKNIQSQQMIDMSQKLTIVQQIYEDNSTGQEEQEEKYDNYDDEYRLVNHMRIVEIVKDYQKNGDIDIVKQFLN